MLNLLLCVNRCVCVIFARHCVCIQCDFSWITSFHMHSTFHYIAPKERKKMPSNEMKLLKLNKFPKQYRAQHWNWPKGNWCLWTIKMEFCIIHSFLHNIKMQSKYSSDSIRQITITKKNQPIVFSNLQSIRSLHFARSVMK